MSISSVYSPDRRPEPAGPVPLRLLSAAVAAWCMILLGGWLPHYLTWPWYADSDHFAILAQLWDSGKVPFRDVFTMQFPGEIYLYWVLGKLTGWGNTVAFRAIDAGMVVALCGLMIAWGIRQFRSALPGLIGASAFLVYYLDKDYTFAGQRDWHATFYAMVGLVLLLGWPGRLVRVISAVGYAMAVLTRPQFALLAPALLIAAINQPRSAEGTSRVGLRGAVEWGGVGLVALLLGFVPLIATGSFADFLRRIGSISYGTRYNHADYWNVLLRVISQVGARFGGVVVPAALLLISSRMDVRSRRVSWALVVAMAGMFFYAPISPKYFAHYQCPFETTFVVATCYLAGLLLTVGDRSVVSVTATVLLLGMVGLKKPEFWAIQGHYDHRVVTFNGKTFHIDRREYGIARSVGFLISGELPAGNPPGFRDFLRPYPWDDSRGVILHLREKTSKDTPVANLLMDSGAAINGAVPRLSPLPADYFGLLSFPEETLAADVDAIQDTNPCVVVWNPTWAEAEYPSFAPIWKAIRDLYRPEAKFGELEVWRRFP